MLWCIDFELYSRSMDAGECNMSELAHTAHIIAKQGLTSLTVGELVRQLESFDPSARIFIAEYLPETNGGYLLVLGDRG